ncbi:MAG TPA: TlpA disulfide reductase family protein [Candidatus Limnocylindrales bacterium]|nr:TlpA disulfide reductase family protein [Candidatus Limnocylindrales bacterium]
MKRILSGLLIFASLMATPAPAAQTLEGQVVCCEDCWAEADRGRVEFGTAEDLSKAAACVAGGDATLLAVREGDGFALYRLEPRAYRLPGKDWLSMIGNHVRITGEVSGKGQEKVVHVDSLDLVKASVAARSVGDVAGKVVDLALSDLSGATQSLAALRGRILIVNFWATYCAPCRTEMPDLVAVQNRYAALGVQVIGAAADTGDSRQAVLQFVRETGINFPVWLGATTADMQRFGLVGALPATVIIGKDGSVVQVIPGVVDRSRLEAQIDAMLAQADASSGDRSERHRASHGPAAHSSEVSSVPS